MTRRGRWRAELQVLREPAPLARGDVTALLVVQGCWQLGGERCEVLQRPAARRRGRSRPPRRSKRTPPCCTCACATIAGHEASPRRTRAAARRLRPRRADRLGRAGPAHRGAARCGAARGCRTHRRPRRARPAQPALARLPARLRRPHRIPRQHAGQLLDLARSHVPLRRCDHARRAGSDRHAALRRDAARRLYLGVRVPLRAPRSGRPALCKPAEMSLRLVAAARRAASA